MGNTTTLVLECINCEAVFYTDNVNDVCPECASGGKVIYQQCPWCQNKVSNSDGITAWVDGWLCKTCAELAADAPRLLQVAKYALLDIAGVYEDLLQSHYGDLMANESIHNTVCDLVNLVQRHSPKWQIPQSVYSASQYCFKCGQLFAIHDNGCPDD